MAQRSHPPPAAHTRRPKQTPTNSSYDNSKLARGPLAKHAPNLQPAPSLSNGPLTTDDRLHPPTSRFSRSSASGFSNTIRSLACWIISTRLSTLDGGGAAPAPSTCAIASSGRLACKKERTSNRSHQQSKIRRQGFPRDSCRQ